MFNGFFVKDEGAMTQAFIEDYHGACVKCGHKHIFWVTEQRPLPEEYECTECKHVQKVEYKDLVKEASE